jgi:gliding motility-associated lipoprotein GldH
MIFRSARFSCYILCIVVMLVSCKQIDVYEKNTAIPKNKWQRNYPATGSFLVTDTTTAYNIYIVLRHTDTYNYNNIWLKVGLQSPGDSMNLQDITLTLASDAGGWEGSGMNDIWEVRKLVVSNRPLKKGEYRFVISHIMRDEPLTGIMSAGLRLTKSVVK